MRSLVWHCEESVAIRYTASTTEVVSVKSTELSGHAEALRLHLDAVLEELNFLIKNAGNEKLKPFVEDQIVEFDQAWLRSRSPSPRYNS
jgi:hypothetical protein